MPRENDQNERVAYLDLPAEWLQWGPEQKGEKGPYWTAFCPFWGTACTIFSSIPPKQLERKNRMVRISMRKGRFKQRQMSAFAPKEQSGDGGTGGF